jgi:malonate-semialdehyde dehydrogenase (acetylating)/methylmalonate-semialdehyde dehydrogenase
MTSTAVSPSAQVRVLANHVGGAWTPSSATDTLDDRDPATGALLARVPLSTAGDVDGAVLDAAAAQKAWRAVSPQQRARAIMGENLEGVATGIDVELVRQPVGVVAAITPFNFPAMIPLTDVCPVVSPEARERLVADIDQAEADGARVVLDGRGDAGPAGCSLAPTILDAVPAGHRVVQEELFGPVLTLVRASDLDAAIDLVNGSRYGNASVIFTASGGAARAYRYGVEAGMVGVAAPVARFPFSGWKDSIDGDLHANGRDAADFDTRKKVVTSRWA